MSAGKLRITIVAEWKVENLDDYDAETMGEAAENTTMWLKNGDHDLIDYVSDDATFVVEVVKE